MSAERIPDPNEADVLRERLEYLIAHHAYLRHGEGCAECMRLYRVRCALMEPFAEKQQNRAVSS